MRNINSSERRMLRIDLCNKADGRCEYCTRHIGMRGTIDHFLPQALGGSDEPENLRWSCFGCNSAKGSMHPEEWLRKFKRPARVESKFETKVRLLARIARMARGVASC